MLDVIVHATQSQVNEAWEFDRQMFRGHTATRFGMPRVQAEVDLFESILVGDNPRTENSRLAAILFIIVDGAFGKPGGGCFLTSALNVGKRFVEEMDFIGRDTKAVFKLGCDVCRADDAGDEVEVARHLVNFILASSPARLARVRAVLVRMVEDLTDPFDAAAVEHAARHIFFSLRLNPEHRLFLGTLHRDGADHISLESYEHDGEDQDAVDGHLDAYPCDIYIVARETDTLADIHDRLTRIVAEVLTVEG